MNLKHSLMYLMGLGVFIGCFVTCIVEYDEYIAGHFPLHLVVFGVPIIGVPLIIIHWHGEATGWKNEWWRKIFRK